MRKFQRLLTAFGLLAAVYVAGYFGAELSKDRNFAQAQTQVQAVRDQLAVDTPAASPADLSRIFKMVGKVVEPSVVSINVRKTAKAMPPSRQPLPFDDDMLRRFFPDRDGDGEPDVPDGFGRPDQDFEQIGTGSGVIVEVQDGKAYVVTNNHVAGGTEEMLITLADGREITNAKLVGADAKTDLAVVRFEADRLIAAKWGDSSVLEKGDWVLAFGSPFGYVGSMSHGIVSALDRQAGLLGAQGYENFIQVDAPINPGNSGGPLVNIKGEIVGINTAIASRSGGFQGIGFAIPSNQAQFVYKSLKEKGKVVRGWLGVSISDVAKDRQMAESFGYKGADGVLVQEILPGTPAIGKLEPGDIITAINGKPARNVQELRNEIATLQPKSDVKMTVFRNKEKREVTVTLGEQPDQVAVGRGGRLTPPPAENGSSDSLGIRVGNISDALAKRFELGEIRKGALIIEVGPNSPAARAGLRPGDVITRIEGTAVSTADELLKIVKDSDLKKGVRLYVITGDGARFVFVKTATKDDGDTK